MAHIRRKFKEAQTAQSKTSKKTGKADWLDKSASNVLP
jgi:hypothetical protein